VPYVSIFTGNQCLSSDWVSPFENVFDKVRALHLEAKEEGRVETYRLDDDDGALIGCGTYEAILALERPYEWLFG
jgi:hypothetical protein